MGVGPGRYSTFTYFATCDPIIVDPKGRWTEYGLQVDDKTNQDNKTNLVYYGPMHLNNIHMLNITVSRLQGLSTLVSNYPACAHAQQAVKQSVSLLSVVCQHKNRQISIFK